MQDSECVSFLQWALPQLKMRWGGFRKVRKRVCQRVAQRLTELRLDDIQEYQHYLIAHSHEWQHLDALCRVVITRFYRDPQVFGEITARLLPHTALNALAEQRGELRAWSIGSASGEEPYTLAILWQHALAPRFSQLQLSILGTEIDPVLIERSRLACYTSSVLKKLPDELRLAAFEMADDSYCLKSHYKAMVEFRRQDIRFTLPDEQFDLILCRNLVFTYFDETQQRMVLQRMSSRLRLGGWLVLGVHEVLPPGTRDLRVVSEKLGLYQREDGAVV